MSLMNRSHGFIGQFRRNGDMFLAHCVETALILAATGVGNIVVAAGLLHDAIDDSNLSLELLRCSLGENVASLVIGVCQKIFLFFIAGRQMLFGTVW